MKQTILEKEEMDYFHRILYALKTAWLLESAVLIVFILEIYMIAFPLLFMLILGLSIKISRIYIYIFSMELDNSILTIKYYKGNSIKCIRAGLDEFRVEYALGGTGLYAFWAPGSFSCYKNKELLVRQVEGPKWFQSNQDLEDFIKLLAEIQIKVVNNWRN